MKSVPIPGGTAQLREKADIRTRDRQLIESAYIPAISVMEKLPTDHDELESFEINKSAITRQEATALFELQNATIIASLASWTLDEPLPDIDTIGDLTPDVFDALSDATASLANEVVAGESFDPSDPHAPGFQDSPTPPSDGSVAVSRADQAPAPIDRPGITPVSTVTAEPFVA